MTANIIHVGLDVDDSQYHGSAFHRDSGEVIDFQCRPTLKSLLVQLKKLSKHSSGFSIKICYEASLVPGLGNFSRKACPEAGDDAETAVTERAKPGNPIY